MQVEIIKRLSAGLAASFTSVVCAQMPPSATAVSPIPPTIAVPLAANILPTPQAIVAGSATLNMGGNISLSSRANLNWQQFSIAQGGSIQFQQPSNSSAALNRVQDVAPAISGELVRGGYIALTNPSGGIGALPKVGITDSSLPSASGNKTVILASGEKMSIADHKLPGVKLEITGAKGNGTDISSVIAATNSAGILGAMQGVAGTQRSVGVVGEGGRVFLRSVTHIMR